MVDGRKKKQRDSIGKRGEGVNGLEVGAGLPKL